MPHREIGDVHRAAAAPTIAVVLAEEFANRAIDVLFQGGLNQILVAGGLAVGNAPAQLLVRHLADGNRSLGQTFAVAAMGAGDVVHQLQGAARSGGGAFLAHGNVRRAAIIKIANRLISSRTKLDNHLLQLADDEHVFQDGHRFDG